ncbi:MAG: M56 family metallopeptidase [Bacteroidota bacterium]
MNSLTEFLSSTWTQTLGWTLLNSLWQGLVVMLITVLALRLIPSRNSYARYIISCSGMLLLIVMNLGTFFYLANENSSEALLNQKIQQAANVESMSTLYSSSEISQPAVEQWIMATEDWLKSNMTWIIWCWALGTLLFSLRLIFGWWYVNTLSREAITLNDHWNNLLEKLAQQLQVDRVVTLAQSSRIHAPVVIGYVKPIILLPAGLLSGLTAEQVETILIHELAHIKRHDFLINLIQSLVEAIFFFNPFVWIMSRIIRREREYCCDDAVVTRHGNALTYAHALAQLEEVRLSHTTMALSIAENKSQLLNRIKRIMEKSVNNQSGRERIIPIILLVVGVLCASWLTIHNEGQKEIIAENHDALAADTSIKKNKSDRQARNGARDARETEREEYEDDDNFIYWVNPDVEIEIPPVPEIAYMPEIAAIPEIMAIAEITAIPGMPEKLAIPPIPEIAFMTDSIPGMIRFKNFDEREWHEFSREFEEKFKERFEDFYKDHHRDFEKMMEEIAEKFEHRFETAELAEIAESRALAEHERMAAGLERLKLPREEMALAQERAMAQQQANLERLQLMNEARAEAMQRSQEDFQRAHEIQAEQLKKAEAELKIMEGRMKSFEKAIKEQLIKDGYMGKDEDLNDINFHNDEITINGKKIKDADKQKYHDLHRKYFKRSGNLRYVE